jgi:hypothetical protein
MTCDPECVIGHSYLPAFSQDATPRKALTLHADADSFQGEEKGRSRWAAATTATGGSSSRWKRTAAAAAASSRPAAAAAARLIDPANSLFENKFAGHTVQWRSNRGIEQSAGSLLSRGSSCSSAANQ